MLGYTVDGSGADCKSAVNDSGGSTPSPSTINALLGPFKREQGTQFLECAALVITFQKEAEQLSATLPPHFYGK